MFLNGSLVLADSEAAAPNLLPLASQRLYPLVVEAADRTGGAVLIELEQKRIPVIAVVLRGPRDGHRRRGGALVAECEDRPRQSASRLHLPIAVPEATKVSAPLALVVRVSCAALFSRRRRRRRPKRSRSWRRPFSGSR